MGSPWLTICGPLLVTHMVPVVPFTDIIMLIRANISSVLMCKSPRAVHVTGKMLYIQGVWKRPL